jgi:hypothetical protein
MFSCLVYDLLYVKKVTFMILMVLDQSAILKFKIGSYLKCHFCFYMLLTIWEHDKFLWENYP